MEDLVDTCTFQGIRRVGIGVERLGKSYVYEGCAVCALWSRELAPGTNAAAIYGAQSEVPITLLRPGRRHCLFEQCQAVVWDRIRGKLVCIRVGSWFA